MESIPQEASELESFRLKMVDWIMNRLNYSDHGFQYLPKDLEEGCFQIKVLFEKHQLVESEEALSVQRANNQIEEVHKSYAAVVQKQESLVEAGALGQPEWETKKKALLDWRDHKIEVIKGSVKKLNIEYEELQKSTKQVLDDMMAAAQRLRLEDDAQKVDPSIMMEMENMMAGLHLETSNASTSVKVEGKPVEMDLEDSQVQETFLFGNGDLDGVPIDLDLEDSQPQEALGDDALLKAATLRFGESGEPAPTPPMEEQPAPAPAIPEQPAPAPAIPEQPVPHQPLQPVVGLPDGQEAKVPAPPTSLDGVPSVKASGEGLLNQLSCEEEAMKHIKGMDDGPIKLALMNLCEASISKAWLSKHLQ